ncbi:putative NBS-LRR resistance protein [Trifolium pratense]|uniref:Putative NBS-LRR resistance protein n=1 Tax=Trifolium pratense TaxID=57577 RepID=A0A2K3ND32_TRIPR|nr:putative NBS-LRR resistance protein [Trifolium pratense]
MVKEQLIHLWLANSQGIDTNVEGVLEVPEPPIGDGGNSRMLQGIQVIPSLQKLTLHYFNELPESLGAMTSLQIVEAMPEKNWGRLANDSLRS